MTCPNCGAELEQHAFVHVCSYCGYVSANKMVTQKDTNDESINFHPYDNILGNLSNIQQSEFIESQQLPNEFECVSARPFYAYDSHFHLDKHLALNWYAKVVKQSICLALLAKSSHSYVHNHICLKADDFVLELKQDGEYKDYMTFPLTISDVYCICTSRNLELETNLYDKAHLNNYEEFITYSHRFFHLVIDKNKYLYSLYQPLLTDCL